MNKIIKIFSVLVICLFLLSIFGWMCVKLAKQEKDFGFLNQPITFMYSFLDVFGESVEEIQKMSPTFLPTPADFEPINKLNEDIKVLIAYSSDDHHREVAIKNLRNDSVLHTISLPDSIADYDRVVNPMLLDNGDLIYAIDMRTGLRRMNKEGKFLWQQDSMRVHHAFNLDSAGNIWTCSSTVPYFASGMYHMEGNPVFFVDDYISKIDIETGQILFHKSTAEILKDNGLGYVLLQSPNTKDPVHLNDVQPALKTTKFYNEGDLFLSSKSLSFIMQYRPSTNEVIRFIRGSFSAQHDVDFRNDTALTWFNNNYYPYGTNGGMETPRDSINLVNVGNFYSNIIYYDFATGSIKTIDQGKFIQYGIFTRTEGLHEYINDSTYFVEQQNNGYIWVIQNGEVAYKNVFASQHEGHHHLPNWTRIISN